MATQYQGYVRPGRADRWQDGANVVLAIWLFISPWVLRFVATAQVTGNAANGPAVAASHAAWNAGCSGNRLPRRRFRPRQSGNLAGMAEHYPRRVDLRSTLGARVYRAGAGELGSLDCRRTDLYFCRVEPLASVECARVDAAPTRGE